MKITKQGIGQFAKAILFLAIVFSLYLFCTYLLRDTDRVSRQNVLEFYNEPENTLDVVLIGASGIYRYWNPMDAWKEQGIASRNFSTSEMHIATYKTAIKEIMKTQNPKMIAVEVRQFTRNFNYDTVPAGARRVIDSMDIGLDRLAAAKYYADIMELPSKEAISLYIDLIQYHDNYEGFLNEINWELADNQLDKIIKRESSYKGYSVTGKHEIFDDPSEFLSQEHLALHPIAEAVYQDLLEWCRENEIPLLLLATPFVVDELSVGRMNTLQDIAETYEIPFLNTNYSFEDMDLDFDKDFYDTYHVNVLGSEKFTGYFSTYLREHYEIADHRNEEAYSAWDDLYEEYRLDKEEAQAKVQKLIERKKGLQVLEEKLVEIDDVPQWILDTADKDITVVLMSNNNAKNTLNDESRRMLMIYNITDETIEKSEPYAIIFNDAVESKITKRKSGKIGDGDLPYVIDLGEEASLLLGETDYYKADFEGIQMFAINNFTSEILDSILIDIDQEGNLNLRRAS